MKTVSLELAKQLKENGYTQPVKPAFYYLYDRLMYNSNQYDFEGNDKMWCASPTADEILEKLPDWIKFEGENLKLMVEKFTQNESLNIRYWVINYTKFGMHLVHELDKSLADAAAKMFIFLKKEGLI